MSETYTTDSAEALAEALHAHTLLGDVCRCGWDGCEHPELHAEHVRDALIASGAVRREAEVRAEAWDEGYTSGFSNAMRRMSDEPDAPTTPNPYRSTTPTTDQPEETP